MKYLSILFLSLVASAHANPFKDYMEAMDTLLLKGMGLQMQADEPFSVSPFPSLDVKNEQETWHVDFNNVLATNVSEFVIKKIEFEEEKMSTYYQLATPAIHLSGNYKATGNIMGHKITGDGEFTVDVGHLLQTGHIGGKSGDLDFSELTLDFQADFVQFDSEGLAIEGMTPQLAKDFFKNQFKEFIKNHNGEVAIRMAAQFQDKFNEVGSEVDKMATKYICSLKIEDN